MTKAIHPLFKALTYKEKLKIYEDAKEYLKKSLNDKLSVFHHSVICAAFLNTLPYNLRAIWSGRDKSACINYQSHNLTEFYKQKPKGLSNKDMWFPRNEDGFLKRLQVLDNCIAICKKHIK